MDLRLEDVASASASAAEAALSKATSDTVFTEALWLLVSLPLAARGPSFSQELANLGINAGDQPSLFDITAGISDALDAKSTSAGGRTDLGEMAQMALIESFVQAVEPELPSLFTPEPAEVRKALGRLAGGDRFAVLARGFFSRLMQRSLDYFLSRELALHVGPERRFETDSQRRNFDAALAAHCHETSRIVEAFAGGWYGKNVWRGDGLSHRATQQFARYAFKKIRDELRYRRDVA